MPRRAGIARAGAVWLAPLLAAALTLAPAPAAPAAPADAKREELKGLKGRIEALQRDLSKSEESRADAAEELRSAERAISDINRRLAGLAEARGRVRAEQAALDAQLQRLGERIARQQEQLGRLLAHQYRAGETDALRHLLSGNDPNQVARDAHYLTLVSQARADLIRALRAAQAEKARLTEAARAKGDELADIEQQEQRNRAGRLEQQKQRQAVLVRIADRIRAQRAEVEKLKHDEQRLTRLVEKLTRLVARPKARGVRATHSSAAPRVPAPRAEAAVPDSAFARLKGRLPAPARGELAGRFGAPRKEGGASWKGVFIRAAQGEAVRAIAAGQVVFADWLRGFGNLIIVDHGDHYLSVYGNNESVLKEAGQKVGAGESIATVGTSGGNPETGLYFELRHLGQPLDPAKWVSLK